MATPPRLIFHAASSRIGISAAAVAEVMILPEITRVPHSPAALLGVIQRRGQVIPVLSAATLSGAPDPGVPRQLLVLRRDPPLALAFDQVESLGRVERESAPTLEDLELLGPMGPQRLDFDAILAKHFPPARAKSGPVLETSAPARKSVRVARSSFLSLVVAGQAFALPLSSVLEVGRDHGEIMPLPRTAPALAGLQAWRGRTIPLVSLRRLLGMTDPPSGAGHRVIVDLHGQPLGLRVDTVVGIDHFGADRIGPAPDLFNEGDGEARIAEVVRRPDGRLMAVLRPDDLLADHRVRGWLAESPAAPSIETKKDVVGTVRRLIVQVGSERFGLRLDLVEEVAGRPTRLFRVPGAPPGLLGVTSLRGSALPLVDLASQLGLASRGAGRRVIVASVSGVRAGFLVDAADEIAELPADAVTGAPNLDEHGDPRFPEAGRSEEGLFLVLDPRAMLQRTLADHLQAIAPRATGA